MDFAKHGRCIKTAYLDDLKKKRDAKGIPGFLADGYEDDDGIKVADDC